MSKTSVLRLTPRRPTTVERRNLPSHSWEVLSPAPSECPPDLLQLERGLGLRYDAVCARYASSELAAGLTGVILRGRGVRVGRGQCIIICSIISLA